MCFEVEKYPTMTCPKLHLSIVHWMCGLIYSIIEEKIGTHILDIV
jgi:hypothetical protein